MRLLILGTGGMAKNHAENFAKIDGVEIVGCVDVALERVTAFADAHKIAQRFTSLEAAIAWGQFDAATNVTPDNVHHDTTLALIAAGKHVLCEKPMTISCKEQEEVLNAAKKKGVFFMEVIHFKF